MMNDNKILTVSYGTFSCTLEGFDDSFGTMKAIAEYFRDLAADDRYFGAEPPQPDAQMLARIAQKEVSRRVEAREHDGKIVLSALENGAAAPASPSPAALVSTQAPTTAAEPEAEAPQEDAIAEPFADAPTPETVEAADTPAPLVEGTETAEDENDIVPGQPDAEVSAFFSDSLADDGTADAEATDVEVAPAEISLNTAHVAEETAATEAVVDETAPPAPEPEADSIAAKLQRIRAVVAQHDDGEDDVIFSEDEHAEANLPEASVPASDDLTETPQIEDSPVPEPLLAATPQDQDIAEDESDVLGDAPRSDADTSDADTDVKPAADEVSKAESDLIAAARTEIEEALHADDTAQTEAEADEDDQVAALLDRLDQDARQTVADTSGDVPADLLATDNDDVEDTLDNLFEADTAADEAEEEIEITIEPEQPALRAPRARVIKVKRADLEAAIESGELEAYDDEEDDAVDIAEAETVADGSVPQEVDVSVSPLDALAPAKVAATSLSPEDEDDLARELAALEADIDGDAPAATHESAAQESVAEDAPLDLTEALADRLEEAAQAEDETAQDDIDHPEDHIEDSDAADAIDAAARKSLPSIDDEQSADMSRLMAETDQQMDEPESATRRDAFAHLRAAVAAKKADASMGGSEQGAGADNAYRSDLAQVVRPRRPSTGVIRTARPDENRTAPLKLVAEQRIDAGQPRPAGPVRPRRVATAVADPVQDADGDSFADFASEMGASTLPQLLEAAAAYMSFVEGREQFSRPQLMTKVRQAGPQDGFSREDGLRSFGQLLRAGKIEKIKGGRFTVSEDIGYRPDQRAAG